MQTRIVDGVKLIEVEPGAPLPPGVPSWAERCDLVEEPDLSPALKPWVIGAGAVGTLGSLLALAFFNPWGIVALLASLVALYHGLVPGTKTVVTPSPTGLYVGFEDDAGKGQRHALSAWDYAILAGMILVGRAVDSFVATERSAWVWVSTIAVAGLYLLYQVVKETGAPVPPDGTARFRELADPARPLTDDDMRLSAGDASPRSAPDDG